MASLCSHKYTLVIKKWRPEGESIPELEDQLLHQSELSDQIINQSKRPTILCIERTSDVIFSDETQQQLENLKNNIRREHSNCEDTNLFPLHKCLQDRGTFKIIRTNYQYSQRYIRRLRYVCYLLVLLGFSWPVKMWLERKIDVIHIKCCQKFYVDEVLPPGQDIIYESAPPHHMNTTLFIRTPF